MAATEREMLGALLELDDKLTELEQEAFPEMMKRVRSGNSLSPAQRRWVEERYRHFELDADEPAENLVSSGRVAKTSVVLPYELLTRPLKPPGRK